MATSRSERELPSPRVQAGGPRQALHLLIAVAGWALFFYWWSLVLARVDPAQVRFTALFVGISLVVVVSVTIVWVLHNLSIFRRRGARTKVRVVDENVSEDTLGRALQFDADREALRSAPTVRVVVDGGRKVYRAGRGPS